MAAAALFYFILQVGGDAAVAGRLATRSTLIGGKHYHPSVPDCTLLHGAWWEGCGGIYSASFVVYTVIDNVRRYIMVCKLEIVPMSRYRIYLVMADQIIKLKIESSD